MPTPIKRLLIANRGEIAARILRTCGRLGIETVAVYSDPDASAPHVIRADLAVALGGSTARETYLDIDKIIGAAKRSGADAVHPGYGFLSENAAFARACTDAGLTFVGPGAEVIDRLGSKRNARAIAESAGVPVVPGHSGADNNQTLVAAAAKIGYPVLLKASAGGGGKGMRIVREDSDLVAAIASARREALSAFGDGALLVERYLEKPRHIEIQILADSHGNVVHLFERECSVQRRHQKIIEEAPAPHMSAERRAQMGAAAIAIAKAVGYLNAGTVEFIVDGDGAFFFLEVNTRLQVEHPVTEMVLGLDLVELQLRVAEGARLPFAQEALVLGGHAVECRLYAEDPDNGFLPTTGTLHAWKVPLQPGLRVDAGVRQGSEIGIHYDPMIAKLIGYAKTRDEAVEILAKGLDDLHLAGLVTNRSFLARVLRHPAFLAGDLDTHFLDRHGADLMPSTQAAIDDVVARHALVAAALWGHEQRRQARTLLANLEPGFRNNRTANQSVVYVLGAERCEVGYRNLGAGIFEVRTFGVDVRARIVELNDGTMQLELDGLSRRFKLVTDKDATYVSVGGHQFAFQQEPRFVPPANTDAAGSTKAPMPGKVIGVAVIAGQAVAVGDALVVLEAMKMEHTLRASIAGVITEILVREGEQVEADQLILVVSEAATNSDA